MQRRFTPNIERGIATVVDRLREGAIHLPSPEPPPSPAHRGSHWADSVGYALHGWA